VGLALTVPWAKQRPATPQPHRGGHTRGPRRQGRTAITTPIRQTTTVRYQDLHVTIIGELDAGLLAIAGYGTTQELAIAAIAVRRRGGRYLYCVAGQGRWLTSFEAVAQDAVMTRQTRGSSRG
jgi:hypothetical protein